jgi:putative membrane protein
MLVTLIASCSQDLTYQEAMNKNRRQIEDPGKLDDATFIVDAQSLNLLEVRLTELATTTGYASAIVDLAKKNLNDHKRMAEEIDDLARRERISIPSEMNEKHEAEYHEVAKADRQDFDKGFIASIKQINDENTQRFLVMATEAKDADVRAFAARKLDMLRTHAQRMEEVERQLLNTY